VGATGRRRSARRHLGSFGFSGLRFANIAALRPRAISIGINADGSATHSLDIKSDSAAVQFSLPQKLIEKQIEDYRKLLRDATFVGGEPRFSTFPQARRPALCGLS
jgi:hypothetical protein